MFCPLSTVFLSYFALVNTFMALRAVYTRRKNQQKKAPVLPGAFFFELLFVAVFVIVFGSSRPSNEEFFLEFVKNFVFGISCRLEQIF